MSQTEPTVPAPAPAPVVPAVPASAQPEAETVANKANKTTSGKAESKDPHALDVQTLEKASVIPVFSDAGKSVEFGTLFRDQKTIVVFIRTFLFYSTAFINICVIIFAY